MIIEIGNEVFTKIKNDIPNALVLGDYPSTKPEFPCIIFSELTNIAVTSTVDSSGEKHNNLSFEINIFTNGYNRKTLSKTLRKQVDDIMSDYYNMNRDSSETTPNYSDEDVYRHTLRYSCVVDENKVIFRR